MRSGIPPDARLPPKFHHERERERDELPWTWENKPELFLIVRHYVAQIAGLSTAPSALERMAMPDPLTTTNPRFAREIASESTVWGMTGWGERETIAIDRRRLIVVDNCRHLVWPRLPADLFSDEGAPPFPIAFLRSASPELAPDHQKRIAR